MTLVSANLDQAMSKKKKKKKKKKEKKGGEERKKERKNKQTNKQTKNTTQKTHRPYSSLDLTDPNFAFGRIFFTILLESLKNQPFWFWAKSFDLVWISVNITWKSQYCLLFTTMGDDYICLGIPVNIRGVDQYPHAIYNKTLNPKTIL